MKVLTQPGIMSTSALLVLPAVLQIFEVTSTTTIRELCCSIASQLKLSSAHGYGLYLKMRKKVRLRFPPPMVM